jgi:GT2 family glycosyltransferase
MSIKISIVVPVYNISSSLLKKCVHSVLNQSSENWELILSDDSSTCEEVIDYLKEIQGVDPRIRVIFNSKNNGISYATNKAIEFSTGNYIAFLDHDDELAPFAIQEIYECITNNPDVDFIYSDEDKIDANGTYCDTYFKPDWSPEHLYSCMYILHIMVLKKKLISEINFLRSEFDGAQDYDLALRATKVAKKIVHIPKILYHWRKVEGSASANINAKFYAFEKAKKSLEQITGFPVEPGLLPGTWRVRPELKIPPPVTLLIITNDGSRELSERGSINLISNLLYSIEKKTTYTNFKILVIDNGNLSKSTKNIIQNLKLDITIKSFITNNEPFNLSKKINSFWPDIDTEFIVIMNDDLEVIEPAWIEALLEPMIDRNVGVVGCRLLFENRNIQHVGTVIGINGGSAHIFQNRPEKYIGYNGFTHIIRNYSAVTGACILTKKSILEQTGGYDERFKIDYNDTDFCLKVNRLGYRVVYTPFASLYHFENSTISRIKQNEEEIKCFNERWFSFIENDPYYNPNLPKDRIDFF